MQILLGWTVADRLKTFQHSSKHLNKFTVMSVIWTFHHLQDCNHRVQREGTQSHSAGFGSLWLASLMFPQNSNTIHKEQQNNKKHRPRCEPHCDLWSHCDNSLRGRLSSLVDWVSQKFLITCWCFWNLLPGWSSASGSSMVSVPKPHLSCSVYAVKCSEEHIWEQETKLFSWTSREAFIPHHNVTNPEGQNIFNLSAVLWIYHIFLHTSSKKIW